MIRPRTLLVALLRFYQRWISPAFGPRCRYHPSCSEYAVQAVERFGIIRGVVLAGWRLLRCNPWSRGGFDPIDDQRLFKPRAADPSPGGAPPAPAPRSPAARPQATPRSA